MPRRPQILTPEQAWAAMERHRARRRARYIAMRDAYRAAMMRQAGEATP